MKPRKGTVRVRAGWLGARVRLGSERLVFRLATTDQDEAAERTTLVASVAERLHRSSVPRASAVVLLEELAGATSAAPVLAAIEMTLSGRAVPIAAPLPSKPTLREVAGEWTSGALAERYPDHVRPVADPEDNEQRLSRILGVRVDGATELGDLAVDAVTLRHLEAAMAGLPPTATRPATRRHYAQVIARVLALAVYPLQLRESSPIPKGWLPRAGKPPAFPWLYPDEESALLGCVDVPLPARVLYAVASREGCRLSELLALQVRDFDARRGFVRLDHTKTGDPRTWALREDVCAGLTRWLELRRGSGRVGPDDELLPPAVATGHEGRVLRQHLLLAGVRRHELHHASQAWRPIRFHDLRAGFVTTALAAGRSEAWVADRTGHRSSSMIQRYRRAARSAAEAGLGGYAPMTDAIPELRCP